MHRFYRSLGLGRLKKEFAFGPVLGCGNFFYAIRCQHSKPLYLSLRVGVGEFSRAASKGTHRSGAAYVRVHHLHGTTRRHYSLAVCPAAVSESTNFQL